jgi:hypothetical protein
MTFLMFIFRKDYFPQSYYFTHQTISAIVMKPYLLQVNVIIFVSKRDFLSIWTLSSRVRVIYLSTVVWKWGQQLWIHSRMLPRMTGIFSDCTNLKILVFSRERFKKRGPKHVNDTFCLYGVWVLEVILISVARNLRCELACPLNWKAINNINIYSWIFVIFSFLFQSLIIVNEEINYYLCSKILISYSDRKKIIYL